MKNLKWIFATALVCMSFNVYAQTEEQNDEKMDEKTYKSFSDRLLNDASLMHIKLDTRFDYRSAFTDGENTLNAFHGQTLKLLLVGEIAPGFRYRLRHRLNKSQVSIHRENYGPATDQAYVEIDAGNFTFRAGKQSVQFGTFEYDVNPADVYMASMPYNDLDAYKAGLNIAYRAGKQTFNVQFINSDATQFSNEEYRNKALAGLFLWEGDLFKGALKTRWGYGVFQYNNSEYNHWVTLGNQLNVGKFSAELDWYYGARHMNYDNDMELGLGIGDSRVEDNSLSLNLTYNFGKIRPQLKAIYDERTDKLNNNSYRNIGGQAVIEYYPFTGRVKDLRFHAMYSYVQTDFNKNISTLSNSTQQTFLVGVRWLFTVR